MLPVYGIKISHKKKIVFFWYLNKISNSCFYFSNVCIFPTEFLNQSWYDAPLLKWKKYVLLVILAPDLQKSTKWNNISFFFPLKVKVLLEMRMFFKLYLTTFFLKILVESQTPNRARSVTVPSYQNCYAFC